MTGMARSGLLLPAPAALASASCKSQGMASAAFEKTLMARKARTGERSMVPPIGGMIPRNKFRYGSASVDTGPTIAEGA